MRKYTVVIHLLLFLMFLTATAFGAVTGKLRGTVADSETGEVLVTANIVVEGTYRGAVTDLDGEYTVVGIPVGVYSIVISYAGYQSQRFENIPIDADRTFYLDAHLVPGLVELEEVIVHVDRPVVLLDITSQRIYVDGESIREMPVQSMNDILETQAGLSTDTDGNLHLRGGRTGEIAYYIDGQRIEDPLHGDAPTGLDRESIEELVLLSGTFNAEYGEAMSGIVNMVTREGGEDYHVSAEYMTPMINSSQYRETDWVRGGSDAVRNPDTDGSEYSPTDVANIFDPPVNHYGRTSLTLSGPVPYLSRTTFFLSGVHDLVDSHLPFGGRWDRSGTGKLSWSPGNYKVTLSGELRDKQYQQYSHAWKYQPDHYHRHFVNTGRANFAFTHYLSSRAFYSINVGWFRRDHDIKIFEDWSDYVNSDYQPEDFTFASYFYDEEDWSSTWREGRTETLSANIRTTCQASPHHEIGIGGEIYAHDIELEDIRELDIDEYGNRMGIIDQYTEDPIEYAVYVQDKIELDYLIVNAGLRFDYADPRTQGWVDAEDPSSELEDVEASCQFSPRVGLAHPITDRLSLHFSYGHFFQFPDYVNLFLNSADLEPDTLANRRFDAVGSRTLKPQKTVAYEVGITGILTDQLGYSLTAFYKDITDLVGTRSVRVGTAYNYAAFVNVDYASVIGFEIGINRIFADNWSLQSNYTYSVAKGNSSEPLTGYWDAYSGQPMATQEYYMDFDRRHVANMVFTYATGMENYPDLFGTDILQNFSVGMIAQYSSGLPYTPYTGAGEQLALRNSERMDASFQVDLRIAREFHVEPVSITAFVNIDNLFDTVNPLTVDATTGQPWETTRIGDDIQYDQIHNPARVDIPRMIRVGLSVEY